MQEQRRSSFYERINIKDSFSNNEKFSGQDWK